MFPQLLLLILPSLSLLRSCYNSTTFVPHNTTDIQVDRVQIEELLEKCVIQVDFVSVIPCEIAGIRIGVSNVTHDGHYEEIPQQTTTQMTTNSTTIETRTAGSSTSSTSTVMHNRTAINANKNSIQTTFSAVVWNSTADDGNAFSTDLPSSTTEVFNYLTSIGSSLEEEETTLAETETDATTEEAQFVYVGDKDPSRPVVIGCETEQCNANLEFTKEKRDQLIDLPKFICLEKFIQSFNDQLSEGIQKMPKTNALNMTSQSTVSWKKQTTTTKKIGTKSTEQPPPTEVVEFFFKLDYVFVIMLGAFVVIYNIYSLLSCIRRRRTGANRNLN